MQPIAHKSRHGGLSASSHNSAQTNNSYQGDHSQDTPHNGISSNKMGRVTSGRGTEGWDGTIFIPAPPSPTYPYDSPRHIQPRHAPKSHRRPVTRTYTPEYIDKHLTIEGHALEGDSPRDNHMTKMFKGRFTEFRDFRE